MCLESYVLTHITLTESLDHFMILKNMIAIKSIFNNENLRAHLLIFLIKYCYNWMHLKDIIFMTKNWYDKGRLK